MARVTETEIDWISENYGQLIKDMMDELDMTEEEVWKALDEYRNDYGFPDIPLWLKMPEYLKKVYEFFKTNNTAKDVLIGSVSFIAGGFVLDRILRRDEEEDE